MKNDLATVVLLIFIDFFFSFGTYHFMSCLLNEPRWLVGFSGCLLTIIANFCIFAIRNFK